MKLISKNSPFILYFLVTLNPLGIDLHLPALVAIKNYFSIDTNLAQLSILVFIFANGIGQLVCGFLSEQFGKRMIGHCGALVFIIGSIGILCTDNYGLLLFYRALQGLGAAALSVIAYAAVNENYEQEEAAIIFSIQGGFLNIIPAIAPVVGAILLNIWDWQLIFVFFVLYAVVIYWQFITRFHYADNPQKSNVKRALQGLLSDKQFYVFASICTCCLAFIFTYVSIAPILMLEQFKMSTLNFSVCFAINAVIISGMSFLLKKLILRFGALQCIFAGLICLTLSSLGLLLLPVTIITFWGLVAIGSIGFALSLGPSMSFALAHHQNYSSIASGVLGFCYLSLSPVISYAVLTIGNTSVGVFGGVFAVLGVLLLVILRLHK